MNKSQLLNETVDTWAINKAFLAAKMGMPKGTFNNKINPKMTAYRFTEAEILKLAGILIEMKNQLQLLTKTLQKS